MNRIKLLREEFNMTQQELADKIDGAKSTIAMYENGSRKPSLDALVKLANIFDCSIDYLLGNNDNKNTLNLFNIPIVGKISAGQPILATENVEGYLPVDPSIYGFKSIDDLFFLRVSGESMNLKVKNGDYALIHKQDYANDGDIVVAIVDDEDEATLKQYRKLNEQFVLLEPMSTDTSIKSITVDLKNTKFKILGKAIGYFGRF